MNRTLNRIGDFIKRTSSNKETRTVIMRHCISETEREDLKIYIETQQHNHMVLQDRIHASAEPRYTLFVLLARNHHFKDLLLFQNNPPTILNNKINFISQAVAYVTR